MTKLFDLGLKFGDRLLKIQKTDGHLRATLGLVVGPKGTGSGTGVQGGTPAPPQCARAAAGAARA